MNPLRRHKGVAVPLLRDNIDTDAIIPSREMRRVSKEGLAEGLFAGWRYLRPGSREPDPDFVLNKPAYAGASVLLGGINFGCGSSREHAVWALAEYGIRVVIAPSFGTIFYNNCVRNGILPIVLEADRLGALAAQIERDPQRNTVTVDLERKMLFCPNGDALPFELNESHRQMLLEGLDPIALTLKSEMLIDGFEHADRTRRPWIYDT